jgi:hypothetical protein
VNWRGDRHVWPVPHETGVWRTRRYGDDYFHPACHHALIAGDGWSWEGPCRRTSDGAAADLRAELDLRDWLAARSA